MAYFPLAAAAPNAMHMLTNLICQFVSWEKSAITAPGPRVGEPVRPGSRSAVRVGDKARGPGNSVAGTMAQPRGHKEGPTSV